MAMAHRSRASWTSRSLWESSADVASSSSRMRMRSLRSSARAMAMRCRCRGELCAVGIFYEYSSSCTAHDGCEESGTNLTARELDAAVAHQCVVAVLEQHDEVVCVGLPRCLFNLLLQTSVASLGAISTQHTQDESNLRHGPLDPVGDVAGNGGGEELRFLRGQFGHFLWSLYDNN